MAKQKKSTPSPKAAPVTRDYTTLVKQYAAALKDGDDGLAGSIMAQIFMFTDLNPNINQANGH